MLVHAAGREKRRTYHVDLVLVVGVGERACRAGGGGVPSSIVSMWCPSPILCRGCVCSTRGTAGWYPAVWMITLNGKA